MQDFCTNNENFCVASFVDDITLLERVLNNRPRMQAALNCLNENCVEVKIRPNPKKCEIMVINLGGRKVKYSINSFHINDINVPVVNQMMVLGVQQF